MIIIILTQLRYRHLAPHGQESNARSQVQSSSARGFLASPSRAGQGRTVFNSRILRSSRLGSGQVRDATPSAKRRTGRERVGSPLWLVAPIVLSSAGGIRAGRPAGTNATQAGPEKGTQAHRRSARFHPPSTARGFFSTSPRFGFAGQKQVRYHRSSTQYRARFDAQSKKTGAVNEDASPCIAQQDWVVCYEQLRSDALSRCHGASSGFGLVVLLREGITAWMRACSRAVTPPVPVLAQPNPTDRLPWNMRTEAVLILAGMLLGNNSEAHPCKPTPRR